MKDIQIEQGIYKLKQYVE